MYFDANLITIGCKIRKLSNLEDLKDILIEYLVRLYNILRPGLNMQNQINYILQQHLANKFVNIAYSLDIY